MVPKPIPDRWLSYSPVGQTVMGTRFIAFKVPLRENVVDSVQDHLRVSCGSLVEKIPNLGMIIDLTNTHRYYSPEFFIKKGIRYEKLMIPGHDIPPRNLVQKFNMMVKDFLRSNNHNTKLIGVHCTHGVNRTGYLICKFMISEMNIQPEDAIQRFDAARGHSIERQNYLQDLTIGTALPSTRFQSSSNWRHSGNDYTRNNTGNSTRAGQTYGDWRRSQASSSNRFNESAAQSQSSGRRRYFQQPHDRLYPEY